MADENNKGEKQFQRVNELMEAGTATRTDAFKQVASEMKSRPGTVAANYYRVARKPKAGAVQARGRVRKRGARRGRQPVQQPVAASPNGTTTRSLTDLADSLVQTATEVAAAMREESNVSADMRARLERVESALHG